MSEASSSPPAENASWTPLNRRQRRVLGVLVEKAKTTPEQYPLSLNGLTAGCNQKNNRSPLMELQPHEVEDALEGLRGAGAVGEVHGSGRVAKYRHYCKEWLGVEGTELAVMAELLLRGPQSVGELRGRAARMAPGQLPDLAALRPVLESLVQKNLVLPLTPEGRGQVVSHNLFPPEELERVRTQFASGTAAGTGQPSAPHSVDRPVVRETSSSPPSAGQPAQQVTGNDELSALREEVRQLRDALSRMQKEIEDLWANIGN